MKATSLSLPIEAPRRPSKRTALVLLALALLFAAIASLGIGAATIGISKTIAVLAESIGIGTADVAPHERAVILLVRLPRVLLAILVGAALASSGALMQGLFRNPLADPSLVGISAGAALGAALVIVLEGQIPFELPPLLSRALLPIAAFLGAQIGGVILHRLSLFEGRTVVTSMLLAGIGISAMAMAGTSALTYVATDEQLRSLSFWAMGSLGGATWKTLPVIAPLLVAGVGSVMALAGPLNAMLLGEAEAHHLGVDVERTKRRALLLTSLMVGASVAICGVIGFVGLIVPHLIRLMFGPDHRFLLPAAALFGPALLLLADLVARTLVAPAELPIGVITAIIGGPFFLSLLRTRHGVE